MAKQVSESINNLEEKVLSQSTAFDFFQAFHLLSRVNAAYPVGPRKPKRKIDVRPELNISFSDNDITGIQPLNKDNGYLITTQLPGLYGVSSPLPDFYTEDLLDDEWDGHEAPRDFLDIIHNQIFPKLYDAWKLYRLDTNIVENQNPAYFRLLSSLMGDIHPVVSDAKPLEARIFNQKLKYFQLFTHHHRSIEGIKILVEDLLKLENTNVSQLYNVKKRIPRDQMLQLGQRNSALGETTHIGEKIGNRTMTIKIHTPIMKSNEYQDLMSMENEFSLLKTLLSEYVKKPIEVILSVKCESLNMTTQLSTGWHQLGQNARLLSNKQDTHQHCIDLKILSYGD